MFEDWKARRTLRRREELTPAGLLREDVRRAARDLLYLEMAVGGLVAREEEEVLRTWFEERHERLTEMRMEFEAVSHRLLQADLEATL